MYAVNFPFTEDPPGMTRIDFVYVQQTKLDWLGGRIFKDKENGQSIILPKLFSMFPWEKHIIAFCSSRCVISKIYLTTGHIT